MFPITRDQLFMLNDEANVSPSLVQDIVIHRIANEIFANASNGKTRYSCDIVSNDTVPFVERLLKMFPDCTIEITGNVSPNWSNLTVRWS